MSQWDSLTRADGLCLGGLLAACVLGWKAGTTAGARPVVTRLDTAACGTSAPWCCSASWEPNGPFSREGPLEPSGASTSARQSPLARPPRGGADPCGRAVARPAAAADPGAAWCDQLRVVPLPFPGIDDHARPGADLALRESHPLFAFWGFCWFPSHWPRFPGDSSSDPCSIWNRRVFRSRRGPMTLKTRFPMASAQGLAGYRGLALVRELARGLRTGMVRRNVVPD